MKSKFGLSYANVVATLALFVALGGGAYAAVKITGRNVKDGSLTTKDIRNGSLLRRDFKAGQLPAGARGATGARGARGAQGVRGVRGVQGVRGVHGVAGIGTPGNDGAPGISGYERVTSATTFTNSGAGQTTGTVDCPGGKKVLSGGAYSYGGAAHSVNTSYATSDTQWTVTMNNTSRASANFLVYAICANVG